MPRTCTICTHDNRPDIDQALVAREPFRNIAARFKVSTSALVRHSDDHLPSSLLKAQAAREAADADARLTAAEHRVRVVLRHISDQPNTVELSHRGATLTAPGRDTRAAGSSLRPER